MRRYSFRLAQVLGVRQTQEDVARAALLTANLEFNRRQRVLEEATAHHRWRIDAIRSPSVPTPTFLGQRFLDETSAAGVVAAEVARTEAATQAASARLTWAEAARRVSALERLDDRRRAEHAMESDRREAIEVDDIVMGRHRRTA